ncbi:MAG TPA: CoA-transferase [Chloroflexota bacterium]
MARTPPVTYTRDEMMTVAAARELRPGMRCFVGVGPPSLAANLARVTHAPTIVLIYESGTIGAKPLHLPLSIGDGELAETADAVVSVPEIFNYWIQPGRIDLGFLGAAQIDRYGNINTTVIGSYDQPKVRLPGAGGAPEIATSAKEVMVIVKQSRRTFVERLDFVTSVRYLTAGTAHSPASQDGRSITVVTDLGILRAGLRTHQLTATELHPGVTLAQMQAVTGWPLTAADGLEEISPPTREELHALRHLMAASREPA